VKLLRVGDREYRIVTSGSGSEWVAWAERAESGERFGVEYTGQTEQAAMERMSAWLNWQYEHASALEALQQAERAYHRTIAGSAFANPTEGPTPIELQREALDVVEAARLRLDDVRGRRPE
jgi:hypothetical protein